MIFKVMIHEFRCVTFIKELDGCDTNMLQVKSLFPLFLWVEQVSPRH